MVFHYAIKENTFSPKVISINGKEIKFTYENNKYRKGGAVIPTERFLAMLNQQDNKVEVHL